MTPEQLSEITRKLDTLTEVVVDLARVQERQIATSDLLTRLTAKVEVIEKRAEATESVLKSWVNRGLGAYAVLGGLATFGFLKLVH